MTELELMHWLIYSCYTLIVIVLILYGVVKDHVACIICGAVGGMILLRLAARFIAEAEAGIRMSEHLI